MQQNTSRSSQNVHTLETHIQVHINIYVKEFDGEKVGRICKIIKYEAVSVRACEMLNIITATFAAVLPQVSSANN
jgi:hypothetical protein